MHDTTIFDGFGRKIVISKSRLNLTSVSGLIPISYIVEKFKLLTPVSDVLEERFPGKRNTLFTASDMFKQRLYGLVCGYEDLNDHESLCDDPGFRSALGPKQMAGGSCLCRFENSFDRCIIDKLNQSLLDTFVVANEAIGLLPKARRANRRCLILDIDSTHIDLYGNQENKSYNAHYQCNCLAPVLCYLNGWPVAIYGAAGTRDGRKVFEHQMVRFITRLKEFFPEYRIVLRGDSGFNSKYIIDTCDELGIFYIFGLSPNKKAQAIAKKGLTNSIQKEVRRYTTAGQTHRSLGEIDYHAKSWGKNKRRIVARKQFDPRTCQLDLRLIQTNIRYTDNETDKGYCGELSSFSPDKLYEKTYCGRGGMEKLIGEFKTECFGARASATRFTTNCYRMILSMFCQLVLKVARHFQLKGVRKNDKKAKEKSVRKFRRDVICVAAQLQGLGELSQMTLPAHLHDEQAYMAMLSIRI